MITRRHLLEAAAVAALTGAGVALFRFRKVDAWRLRPPGAQDAGAFEAACIRCVRCAEVCPPQCITFPSDVDPALVGTPFIDANNIGCIMCMQCGPACPTGALVVITQREVRMGTPALDKKTCFPHSGKRPCRLCHDVCPLQGSAITLNARLAPVFHDACTGCGLCQAACPAENEDGERAIVIVPRGVT